MSATAAPDLINPLIASIQTRIALPAFAATMLVGCVTAPITERPQFNVYSQGTEARMGVTAFSQIKAEQTISTDPQINEMVQRVGTRIAAAAAYDLPGAEWEFVVFENDAPNAFCLPGGKVGIYTGILPITKDEAGLATVIGHEVAHAAARHGGERMTTAAFLGLGQIGVDFATRNASDDERLLYGSLYGAAATLGGALPHSRLQESEADRIGLTYMARAGYDPQQAVAFWLRFAEYNKQQGGETLWFLRTHPLDEERARDLEKWIPEARQQYRPSQ